MKTVYLIFSLLLSTFSYAQEISKRLDAAIKKLQADDQFKHAIISIYVIDSKTGKPVFGHNSQLGLAPASCQKVVTSVTAYEMLGGGYTYKTQMGYDGSVSDTILNGNLYFTASGDPTLGSWRWATTTEENIEQKILSALKAKSISAIKGNLIINKSKWESQGIPGGWIWEDIGNYYGVGARGMNWHENQYDLILKPGKKMGDPVEIAGTKPVFEIALINELKTGAAGSGDQSVIYLPEDGSIGYVRGTVPTGKETFIISGSIPDPAMVFTKTMRGLFDSSNIKFKGESTARMPYPLDKEKMPSPSQTLMTISSPPLDSINYWFLKKSVNLYGEALVKTISYEKTKFGSTDTGINIIRNFWQERGIEKSALNIIDGSGLSPANRVTTHALVTVMQYAKKQHWYSSFYNALPEQNGIRMKSGSIGGVRSYTGYIKSKSGAEYTFAFIINNYDGNPGTVREKMWKLLDVLK